MVAALFRPFAAPVVLAALLAISLPTIGETQSRVALTARQGGKEMFIVTEYYNGGTLESIRTALCDTPKCAKRVAILVLMQMAKALACMHDAGYVHADLKPDNILFSVPEGTTAITLANVNSLRFILADYGLAQRVGASKVMSGTPLFMAPEAFDNGPASPARDIWALGVLMYLLIYNVYPYTATTLGGLLHALKSPPTFPTASETQPALVQLVKRMLSRDPTQRPTARDIIAEVPRIASSA
mgnify:CR=1 FL=1